MRCVAGRGRAIEEQRAGTSKQQQQRAHYGPSSIRGPVRVFPQCCHEQRSNGAGACSFRIVGSCQLKLASSFLVGRRRRALKLAPADVGWLAGGGGAHWAQGGRPAESWLSRQCSFVLSRGCFGSGARWLAGGARSCQLDRN